MKFTPSGYKKECAIYTISWLLYESQGVLGIGALAKYLIFFLIAYSLFRTIYVSVKFRFGPFMKGLTVLFLLLSVYGIYHLIFGRTRIISEFTSYTIVPTFYNLKYIYCSIPNVYVYYFFAKRGVFTPKSLTKYAFLFIIAAVLTFFNHYSAGNEINGSYEYVDGITNNTGYKFVPIMALAFLTYRYKSLLEYFSYFFIILSLKRGAFLIGSVSLIGFLSLVIKKAKGFKRFQAQLFAALTILLASLFVIHFFQNSEGFRNRIEMTLEGNSSGRDIIAEKITDYFQNQTDYVAIAFGNGADATIDIAGNYAHNDWLELLINQGILGVSIFFIFYMLWFKNYLMMRKKVSLNVSMAFGVAFIGSFGASIFSMAYTAFGPSWSIVIGYCLSEYSKHCSFSKIR